MSDKPFNSAKLQRRRKKQKKLVDRSLTCLNIASFWIIFPLSFLPSFSLSLLLLLLLSFFLFSLSIHEERRMRPLFPPLIMPRASKSSLLTFHFLYNQHRPTHFIIATFSRNGKLINNKKTKIIIFVFIYRHDNVTNTLENEMTFKTKIVFWLFC